MYLADSLSRPNSMSVASVECIRACDSVEEFVSEHVGDLNARDAELRRALKEDTTYQRCMVFLNHGWPEGGGSLGGELQKLYNSRNLLTVCNELIMYGSRMYIPAALRISYLQRCHEGHQAVSKFRERAKRMFWWPTINPDIGEYMSSCERCIKAGVIVHQPCVINPIPVTPWAEVGTDVFAFEGDLYLVLVDYCSKWIEALRIPLQTSTVVIDAMKMMFAHLGVPKRVRSDNGPCYASSEFQAFAENWRFVHVTSSPRYPQSNGLAERAVGIVKHMWRKTVDRCSALLAYRSTPMKTGFTPGELLYGREIRSTLGDQAVSIPVDYGEYEQIETEMRMERAQKWDRNHKARVLPRLLPGKEVWVKAPGENGFEAVVKREDDNPDSMWLCKQGGGEVRRNKKRVFPFPRDEEVQPSPTEKEVEQHEMRPPALKQEEGIEDEWKVTEDVKDRVGLDTPEPDSESDEDRGIPELFRSNANVEHPIATRQGRQVKSTRCDDSCITRVVADQSRCCHKGWLGENYSSLTEVRGWMRTRRPENSR